MKTLIIIPTYNEIDNAEKIINTVLSQDPRIDILIIDDNSPDKTALKVKEMMASCNRIKIIERPSKMGLGTAYVTGFKYAIENEYDFVFEMDADFSHDPADIKRFLKEIESNDLVIGSRYSDGVSVVNWPMKRLLLSYFANIYAKVVTGVPVDDLTGGFKCYRVSFLKNIDLNRIKSDGYGFQIEIDVKIYKKRGRVKEIPIIFRDRVDGYSKMNKKIIWEAFWLVWRLRVLSVFRKL
ncbi:MAG: polyprenol monophosphomannose synthase [bacterium]|nr:polyprenol monophosphomannose synthase [bacterium]